MSQTFDFSDTSDTSDTSVTSVSSVTDIEEDEIFLAVQDSSIGGLVSQSVSQ